MKFYPCCFILILILGACSFNNEEKFNGEFINNFPSAVEIEGTRVFESEMGIASVLHLDSLTIISTSGEPFIKVYESNQQLISQFGKEGRGPGEFSMPPFIRDAIDTKSTTEIVIYDEQLLTLLLSYVRIARASARAYIMAQARHLRQRVVRWVNA